MVIRLEDIQFHAYHGVYPEERTTGNTFLVSVSFQLPEVLGIRTDDLRDTVDYQRIYQLVEQQMLVPSNLLEHVAGRIRDALKEAYPMAEIKVIIKKMNPPIGGVVAYAAVEV